jgi:hypothetical protein
MILIVDSPVGYDSRSKRNVFYGISVSSPSVGNIQDHSGVYD